MGIDISASVVANLSQYPFWTTEVEAAIRRDVGDDGLEMVREAHKFAADQEDLWLRLPYRKASERAKERVRNRFPQFTPEAIHAIVILAAYNWK